MRRTPLAALCLALALPAGAAGAQLPGWTAHGPAGSSFRLTRSPGFTPRMTYAMKHAGGQTRTWSLTTVSPGSGRVSLEFHYQGFHAYFDVTVFLTAVVVHDGQVTRTRVLAAGPAICCTSPSEAFDYRGTVGLIVRRGDRYGFEFGGGNGDSFNELHGTLQLTRRIMLSGNWQTRYGPMRLRQSGDRVTGNYGLCDGKATLRGRLVGGVLFGRWHEPCYERSGGLRFVFNRAGTAFRGLWNYFTAPLDAAWNGHRV